MQRQTADRIGLGSIFPVTGHRVSDPLAVSADLIFPAGFQLELNQCIRHSLNLFVSYSLTMSCGKLPVFARRFLGRILRPQFVAIYLEGFLALVQPALDPAFLVLDLTLEQCYITSFLHRFLPIAL